MLGYLRAGALSGKAEVPADLPLKTDVRTTDLMGSELASGPVLPASETREVVDLDQLFNTLNPKTRAGLQQFIQGTAEQYAGAGHQLGRLGLHHG